MASYSVRITRSAAKELEAAPKQDRVRIAEKIQRLSADPRPIGSEKLSGEDKYRIRQGDYRILYTIDDEIITVLVVKIGHRKDVYNR